MEGLRHAAVVHANHRAIAAVGGQPGEGRLVPGAGRLIPFQRNIKAPDWRPMLSETTNPPS